MSISFKLRPKLPPRTRQYKSLVKQTVPARFFFALAMRPLARHNESGSYTDDNEPTSSSMHQRPLWQASVVVRESVAFSKENVTVY